MKTQNQEVYLPDTRGVAISPYGKGNYKLGKRVYTYSRLPGWQHTCPGSTEACEAMCYAKRITGPVADVYARNSETSIVPPIPEDCRLLRIHVSGDFDTVSYIDSWIRRLEERPDVTAWAYTRSWRVESLRPQLEELRELPNMQLFASVDGRWAEHPRTASKEPWRLALVLDAEEREHGGVVRDLAFTHFGSPPGLDHAYVCPEQTGHKESCEDCRYCFDGFKNHVVFLEH